MSAIALRNDEKLGLGVAVALHLALLGVLLFQPRKAEEFPLPERMTVTLSDEVGLQSTSPEPMAAPAPDQAPQLGEAEPEPLPVAGPAPRPEPLAARPQPSSSAPSAKSPAKPQAPPKPNAGASRIGNDFLKGVPGSNAAGSAKTPPAAAAGPAVKAALSGAIAREIKDRWASPQGAEVEKLVTILAWDLNPDGSLAGPPRLVRQEGITDANRTQAPRHLEQAIRAVKLAAPFDLPQEYYSAWKRISAFRFDRKLSQ